MPKCRICDNQIPPGVDLCPACGAPVPATTKAISAEFEQELLDLLNKGQEPDAVARYREVTGISLGEARTAIQQLRQRSAVADQLGPQLQQELMGLLHSGQKIKAIKIYKEQMNLFRLKSKIFKISKITLMKTHLLFMRVKRKLRANCSLMVKIRS